MKDASYYAKVKAKDFDNGWRRLHGGIAHAPAYQLWLSAIGLQAQRNPFFDRIYPWLGFRIGTIGTLKVDNQGHG